MTIEENQNGNGNGAVLSTHAPCKIKVTNTGRVVPTKDTAEKPPCPLITFDLPYITFYYNQKLLVYKTAASEYEEIVGKMKEGLGAALDYFYPLAGRIVKDEEGTLVVDCNGESLLGAEVMEAVAEGVTVEELAENDADEKLLQEVVPYTRIMNLEGLHRPLLAVQFTKLKDGLAVGCAFNHAILDGTSTWHFMTSWSELTRTNSISLLPLHDRTKARSTRVKLNNLPASPKAHELADPSGSSKPLVAKVFSFTEQALKKLKSQANANANGNTNKPFSTFQSLGDHVWRCVCRARALKPEDYTCFAIFMDCRSRVEPPMPPSYFGNLIQAIFTVTASGLLQASPPEFGAGLLQNVIDGHDAKAINARLDEYEAQPKMFHYKDAGINTVAVGSSPRFRVYDVDFGYGRPERVRSGSNNKFDGMMFLYPGRDGPSSKTVGNAKGSGSLLKPQERLSECGHEAGNTPIGQFGSEDNTSESDLQMHPLLFQTHENQLSSYFSTNCHGTGSGIYNFFPGNPAQSDLNLLRPQYPIRSDVHHIVAQWPPKAHSTTIDFHPLLQRIDNENENNLDLDIRLSSTSNMEKTSGRDVPDHNVQKTVPKMKRRRYSEVPDTDNLLVEACSQGDVFSLERLPSNKDPCQWMGNLNDDSMAGIVMEQEELSDSDEEIEDVEFECEEIDDSEGDEMEAEQPLGVHDKEKGNRPSEPFRAGNLKENSVSEGENHTNSMQASQVCSNDSLRPKPICNTAKRNKKKSSDSSNAHCSQTTVATFRKPRKRSQ